MRWRSFDPSILKTGRPARHLSRSLDHSIGATGSGPARSALPRSGFVLWPIAAQGVQRTMSATGQSRHANIEKGIRFCRVGPGNFTLSPSQIPYVNLSIHTARVTARRLPPSAERSGSSRFDPVGPSSTAMTCPLCSTGITPLQRYYEAVRPSPAHRYFRPCGWRRLGLFPWQHRRPGSHVPYKSLVELRAIYMPDVARSVSGHPPS